MSQLCLDSALSTVERVTGVALPCPISVATAPGLRIDYQDNHASVAAEDESALCRALFLLTQAVKAGESSLHLTQTRHIACCGAMLDMSRNGVMTVEAVQRYLDRMACLGMNMLMLYTEDTYEVPEYPRLGYLRGRYSQAELRQLDDYAAALGIELIPCIQTLGHMSQFLQWPENAALCDQGDVLLADDEAVYRLIEAEIRAVRACMRTKRIHVGMDEAHGVGLGRYYEKHGATDRFDLLNRHLARVVDICLRNGFEPIMWSDMFFRLASTHNEYYDREAIIPQRVIDAIPAVSLCYWDYYHQDEDFYEHMFTQHERTGRPVVFAGGCWTWAGFLPQVKRTEATMRPALRIAAAHRVETVMATLWGDDGEETDYFLGLPMLPMFSEACWQGTAITMDEALRLGEAVTGLPAGAVRAMGEFFPDETDNREGKSLIWCDALYPLLQRTREQLDGILARFDLARQALAAHDLLECRYAAALMDVASQKALLLRELRPRYLAKDRAYLTQVAEEIIPALLMDYDRLMRLHRALWERDMKRFGWEVLSLRYGGVTGRLRDVQDLLRRYLAGEVATIQELDAEPLPGERYAFFGHLVTPMAEL
ncbi:MAG: family 20 glycosylhydrolase [Clostridiales bacterium]|nr:family 20 glycosylhydrolase [Clostridiales bacterium]